MTPVTQNIITPDDPEQEATVVVYGLSHPKSGSIRELRIIHEPQGSQSVSIIFEGNDTSHEGGDRSKAAQRVRAALDEAHIGSTLERFSTVKIENEDPALMMKVVTALAHPKQNALQPEAAAAIISYEAKRTGESPEVTGAVSFNAYGGYDSAHIDDGRLSSIASLEADGWSGNTPRPFTRIEFHNRREAIVEALEDAKLSLQMHDKTNRITVEAPIETVANVLSNAGLLPEFVPLQIKRRANTNFAGHAARPETPALGLLGAR